MARFCVAALLFITAAPCFAQAVIEDWMYTSTGRLRGSMLPPMMLYDDSERLQSFLAAEAPLAGDASGLSSFASASLKGSSQGAALSGVTVGWHERAPVAMMSLASPPLADMISPINSGGAINSLGPRVSPVPEPSTYVMLLAGLLAVSAIARKRAGS